MADQWRSIHQLSKEFVKFTLTADGPFDPVLVQVKVGSGPWRETDVLESSPPGAVTTARFAFLVEPLVDDLQVGSHAVLAKLTDNPELPVLPVGDLTVTR